MLSRLFHVLLLATVLFILGCSSGDGIGTQPPVVAERITGKAGVHQLWGLWQFTADPDAGTLEAVPFREAGMHLNALRFLEPPVLVNLTLESVQFNGNIIEADIGLRHPFLGMTRYSGFDVCGILISSGSVSGYSDPEIIISGDGDTRLTNYDGLTRWWNPVEFPVNLGTMFSYNDGLLGIANSTGNFSSTLNGYKYYCDDLINPDDPMSLVTISGRSLFTAGQKNVRRFMIKLGNDGLIFNYAVDANWKFPDGNPPWTAPDDFGPDANRPEAWNIEITELDNTVYFDNGEAGGDLSLEVTVFDHFNSDTNTVRIEAPSEIPVSETSIPVSTDSGFSVYQVTATDCTPTASGELEIFITIESEATGYGGLLPGKPVSAYFTHIVDVGTTAPPQGDCPDVTNQAYPFTLTPTTMSGQYYYVDPLYGNESTGESCIDIDFLNNDQNQIVLNARDNLNQIGSIVPQFQSDGSNPQVYINGVETMSIDCDRTDRIVYVLFDDSVLPSSGYPRYFPQRTNVALGADTKFFVFDISLDSHIGTSYDVGAKIWAIETDADDDIWVLDENRYMHHYVNNDTSYSLDSATSFDLDTTIPGFSGIAFDFVIDFYNEAFYILTNGALDGILYRVECDGSFNASIDSNPNPMTAVWDHTTNDRGDIVIDNLDASGNVLTGQQDAQIICFGNLPGTHYGQSDGASKIGITRVDAALGSEVKYEFLGGTYVGYGVCAAAINQRTHEFFVKNGPPYGNQHIIHKIFIPSVEWY